jgi:signal transduction histidine kinase
VRSQLLAEADAMITDLLARIRRQSLELRPGMLDDLGLVPALASFVERFTAQTGVAVELEHAGLETRLGPEVETAAFRIVQAALTNVACHADIDRATVRAWCAEQQLHLVIADSGKGFVVGSALRRPGSLGLAGMRERSALLGGALGIDSAPGAGTRITAVLPTHPGSPESGKR